MVNNYFNENCLDTMGRMPNGYIDLTVTSPPYDTLRYYHGYEFNFENIARELYRVTKDGGVVVWIVSDETINGSETGTSFQQALYFKEIGFNIHDTMIWDKMGMRYPDKIRYSNCFEYMFVFSKGKPKTVNLIKDRPNIYQGQNLSRKSQVRGKNGDLKPNSAYKKKTVLGGFGARFNIWRKKTTSQERNIDALKHPAPFSEDLAKDHIYSWSNEGGIVYDPMAGSGTTPKCAHLLNRKWIASELSHEYCELMGKRLHPYLSQKHLFNDSLVDV